MIPIGVATNFVGGQLAILLKLPVYFDSIGTILVGALCGGLPGALVGAISNVINSITNPTTMVYAIINILIGLAAGLLSKRGWFTTFGKALATVIPFAIIGGFGGALISLWIFGGLTPNGVSVITAALYASGFDMNVAVYLSGVPLDLVDKLVVVVVVFLILRRVPSRLLAKLPLGHVFMGRVVRFDSASNAELRDLDDDLAL
ncbi:hypothetical protein [Brachybacterium vulturis]|nr:hypothetical protein [Brachybacterium vulturis]